MNNYNITPSICKRVMFWVACSQSINLFIINYFVCIKIEHLKMVCGFVSKYFDTYNFAMVCRYTTLKLLLKSPAGHYQCAKYNFLPSITWVGICPLPIASCFYGFWFCFVLFDSNVMLLLAYCLQIYSCHFSSICFFTSKQVVKSLGATCS